MRESFTSVSGLSDVSFTDVSNRSSSPKNFSEEQAVSNDSRVV